MRTITLSFALLAGTTLAGCHHRRTDPDDSVAPVTSTTTTTTTTTTSEPMSSPSTSTTATSMTTTSERRERTEMHNEMRMERREVHMGIHSLERARRELEHAGHDFGGHRVDALRAVDGALKELRMASGQEAREARTGMETPKQERAEGRELHVALADLERARADMEHAPHNFSGRRKEALEAVDAAIREVRRAAENER